ncbi:MAG: 30S ribosomal protein S4 [Legionellaceae bacterium]
MARIRGRRCARSRVLGPIDLTTAPLEKKCKKHNVPPGQHGASRSSMKSEYGKQLLEKQKAKNIYGILEKQFRNYYKKADNSKGATGTVLLQLLESRLDNVVYRMGFAATRAEARQIVNHRSVMVNGRIVNIASCILKPGDIVEVKEKSKSQLRIQAALQLASQRNSHPWVEVNEKNVSGTLKHLPEPSDLPNNFNAQLIIEYYSK